MAIKDLNASSISFEHNTSIPKQFTCEGENINPHIRIDEIPETAESLAIIVEDPDAPDGTFTHWMAWNIPPRAKIMENSFPEEGAQGRNDFGKLNYMGPCPPEGEEHRYFFKVYALDSKVDLDPAQAEKKALEIMIEEKKIGYGELIGLYKKS
jgi:Raf kinase inhibitor-like YbhB/YbcL family protein